ncbi:hypothetical protein CLOP_g12554, partial [Closterium sp. NIES-67]
LALCSSESGARFPAANFLPSIALLNLARCCIDSELRFGFFCEVTIAVLIWVSVLSSKRPAADVASSIVLF